MKQIISLIIFSLVISPALFANESPISAKFSHAIHVGDEEIPCFDCHGGIATSGVSEDMNYPREAVCLDCHDRGDDEETEECQRCHDTFPVQARAQETNWVAYFNHKVHIDNEVECSTCHSVLEGDEKATPVRPKMAVCRNCHEPDNLVGDCRKCHLNQKLDPPQFHTIDWRNIHGRRADEANAECSSCHAETFCEDCHEGRARITSPHNPGFFATHKRDAMFQTSSCMTCHKGLEDCINCHQKNRLMPRSHSRPGWKKKEGHGQQAEFNMTTCVSCHQGTTTCDRCHK